MIRCSRCQHESFCSIFDDHVFLCDDLLAEEGWPPHQKISRSHLNWSGRGGQFGETRPLRSSMEASPFS